MSLHLEQVEERNRISPTIAHQVSVISHTKVLRFVMTAASIQFPFKCDISLEDYRKLWRSSIESQRTLFRALERLRTVDDISSFLDELNDLDLERRAKDIAGVVWQGLHPDAAFRDEATSAQKAFTILDAEISTSSALHNNLALYEATVDATKDDTKRMLQE